VIRRAYVTAVRGTVGALERTGADRWLSSRQSPMARHVWSLSAIYDAERMASLDLPWWTYRAAEEVDRFLALKQGGARVFEFGSGASTLWLAKRAREVHSVEHDEAFAGLVRSMLASHDNVELRCVPPTERSPTSTAVSERAGYEHLDFEDYVGVIDDVGGAFDLIVIDGRARPTCLDRAVSHLDADGVVVFDNAGRHRYRAAMAASGLVVDMKTGWAPSLPYREATALLRRPS
jgi:predicted O-methyltransferase YrrM